MKNKKNFPNFLFRPRGQIIIALLLFSTIAIAQESTPEEFVIGATFDRETRHIPYYYEMFRDAGMNFMPQYADGTTINLLNGLNCAAYNSEFSNEWIYYYSTAYYSKWEAEENQTTWGKVGVKHDTGKVATYQGRQCWSTEGLIAPACSLMYGPHYHQEKTYKRWYNEPNHDPYDLKYVPRFIMALKLEDGAQLSDTASICRLSVVERYRWFVDGNSFSDDSDMVLKSVILKASDFQTYGTFKSFYIHQNPDSAWYDYPPEFRDPPDGSGKRDFSQFTGVLFFDKWGNEGVQFRVDWLGDNTKCNLYIDYVEVYDNKGGQDFKDSLGLALVANRIQTYAQGFPQSEWSNMKYWGGCDEPSSLDDYIPLKTVDSALESIGAPRLITTFYPFWQVKVNEDTQLVRYYNTVQPAKLIIDFFPCISIRDPAGYDDWETTRKMLQICSTLQPGFWYQAQAAGIFKDGVWKGPRRPDSTEFKAQNMLALAHGVKGLIYWHFRSWGLTRGLLEPDSSITTSLYDTIKYNIAPRLKGKLGKTLLGLDYSGNYINQFCDGCPPHDSPVYDYLTLDCSAAHYYWHVGFFRQKDYADNKYFFLTNLRTVEPVTAILTVRNNTNYYNNVSFTDIEGGAGRIDTTLQLNQTISRFESMPPGEGRLYRVSPVVLHGGRLLYDENAYGGQELTDDMIIENGATLTIFDEYVAKANIIVKNGSIVNGENGKIQFAPTKRLIVEGQCSISGSAGNKLNLEFEETTEENQSGIVIQEGGSLTIANCQVDDATIGINSLLNADYLNAQYIDFINCRDYTINIAGRSSGENPTPPSQIKYCTITGSDYGISILNLSEINIQENTITNTNWGIFLSSATNVSVIDNQINTNTDGVSGIYVNSSSGAIRGNSISGHEVGIYLANSSPDVGGNDITDCLYHGMYIGDGSIPNMQGRLVLNGGNHAWYATSGYNHIYDNGGYEGPGEDNDGSEIYFNGRQANAIMEKGCNMIIDDREPSPPLINTELLMNCPFGQEIEVSALHNYWGETEVTEDRFGNLLVDFGDALAEPCPLPDGSGDEDELIVKSSSGEIIDTVYSIGEEVTNITATELAYSEAEEKFLSGDMTSAMQLYDGIIASGVEVEEKYLAYERKYEIGRITGQPPEYFNQLESTFASLASSAQDSISQKILEQYSILSKVGEQEYEESIGEFDAIIQQNPNTEEAFYAEIDAITTAILIEEADSSLHKGRLGKYLIKPGENYLSKLDAVLRKHFGNGDKESEKETLPTEYTLYQNYPNPFNPLTTIKYDLPNAGDVSLIIYDILGRKVKELVNTKQQAAGRYVIQFNASSLASGVYIYHLIAEKYISSKKMILLK